MPNQNMSLALSSSFGYPLANSVGTSHITASPGTLVDLSVFDWNSIPNPLVETTMSTSTCRTVPDLT